MITQDEIKKISKLSRLTLSDQELNDFYEELNSIVNTIQKLNELDTQGIEPTYAAALDIEDLRDDIAKPSMDRDQILQNAPESEDGAFKVPTIVE
jgi:aspartyl-tRNA(Asn)/glutamyl-tRNA(Gln) amidotransferase subunit C